MWDELGHGWWWGAGLLHMVLFWGVIIAVIVLLVGFGRIYVGAHWPSDVLGGYLWGAILLMAVYAAVTTIQRIVSRN